MSSPLFQVKVEKIEGNKVDLREMIIHPDQRHFYASTSFALMLLTDDQNSEIARDFPVSKILDEDYVYENMEKYISNVEYLEYPSPPRKSDSTALIRITVTDPKWISHLKVGQEWESTAFNL